MRDRARENWQFAVTFGIWLLGLLPLSWLWYLRLSPVLEEVYGFAVYLIAFFYFVALGPIHAVVKWYWPGTRQEREEYERRLFTE